MKWKSIKEKLPKHNVPVFVMIDDWIQVVRLYSHCLLGKHGWDETTRKDGWMCICEESYYDLSEFTHWKSLPKLPKVIK